MTVRNPRRPSFVMTLLNSIGRKPETLQSNLDVPSQPPRISLLLRFKERSLSGAFVTLTVLAMVGWIYLLSSTFVRFVLWFFS